MGLGLERVLGLLPGRATPADDLAWERCQVQGRPASYCAGGDGPPVVFLHGWALGNRTYRDVVRQLTARRCRVYAPDLPGFGGTAGLPTDALSIQGLAEWVDDFMTAVGIEEPALVIGHSFGGGVAITLAHRRPERVRYLVVLNSIGAADADRPLWSWAYHFSRELFPRPQNVDVLQAISSDVVANVLRRPLGLWRAAGLARRADLTEELADLRSSGMPMLAIGTDGDSVIPQAAFLALCAAVGTEGRVVPGRHSWLLADPGHFGEVLANVVEVQVADHRSASATSRAAEVADLLAATNVPPALTDALLAAAAPLWLLSEEPAVLAGDLALCHPALAPGEVRAVARAIEGSAAVRLTVVAADRPGLLADSAAALSGLRLSIGHASAVTWTGHGLAVHALTLAPELPLDDADWARIGSELQAMGTVGATPSPAFEPAGDADVIVHGPTADRSLVRVSAPDQLGLLWATCRWFADHDVSIESVHATTVDGRAEDTFVVTGTCDADELAAHLSRPALGWLRSRSLRLVSPL
ncbi:MAG: Alpha/beta hydrolase fold [Actinomycetia bacterium]|nr:Alpha/beta hydrolase fold [Actinomycetes bacterium]